MREVCGVELLRRAWQRLNEKELGLVSNERTGCLPSSCLLPVEWGGSIASPFVAHSSREPSPDMQIHY
jgi:hypothetical protein